MSAGSNLSAKDVRRSFLGHSSGQNEVYDTERDTQHSVHPETQWDHEVGHKQDKDQKPHLVCTHVHIHTRESSDRDTYIHIHVNKERMARKCKQKTWIHRARHEKFIHT